jgi:3-methyladenine DNA glycosylase AlkD
VRKKACCIADFALTSPASHCKKRSTIPSTEIMVKGWQILKPGQRVKIPLLNLAHSKQNSPDKAEDSFHYLAVKVFVSMQYDEVIARLKAQANPDNVAGMARYGISTTNTLGISINTLRKMAKELKKDHELALKLWDSGFHEARILANFIDEPEKVTEAQLEHWVRDFDSWDVGDQVSELIAKTPFVIKKINDWAGRDEEFVKRAAFSLIAEVAWYDKKMVDDEFEPFFELIKNAADDERNYVKKAVNWALRNIGRRNKALNRRAIEVAREIQKMDSKAARWIASDALRKLTSEAMQKRLAKRQP